MIRIDLGKASRKQGEKLRRIANQLKLQQPYEELLAKFDGDVKRLVTFFVAIALAILPYLVVGEYQRVVTRNFERKMQEADKEIAVVESEIQTLLPFKQELESYEAQKAQVTQRLTIIQSLLDRRALPVSTLDAVGQALPEAVWLETMAFEGSDKAGEKMVLNGKSLSNEDISDFADRLAQSSRLKNVRINSVEATQVRGQDIKSFQIDLEAAEGLAPARAIGSQ
jgi:Tfp pilus assembly protein PilN